MTRQRLTVVAPVYNEVRGIEHFTDAVLRVLVDLPYDSTVVLVDDGSTDGTAAVLDRLHDAHPDRLTVIHLSRNFGHQAALTAGMDYADGDAVICMDADLQHPPSVIPQMLERWQHGFDIVQTVRQQTENVGWFKDVTARLFYALINYLSATRIEPNGCDFRLLSRRVVEVFRKDIRERDRFIRGLVSWVGFRYCTIEFDAASRFAGETKYSLTKMLSFARVGLVSFSKVPLKVAALFGFGVSVLSGLYGLFAVSAYLFFSRAVMPGWASMIVVATFLGGCQLVFLGLIGEYIATIFDETKGRPLYIVADVRDASAPVSKPDE
ncbi:MAG TPA: glycosyltransferase family 2 protein [Candidatus Acidoferrales bacterium]|nr:glycosyltransferase family 2 protein [Candidatus Acidoferrales bacterium]